MACLRYKKKIGGRINMNNNKKEEAIYRMPSLGLGRMVDHFKEGKLFVSERGTMRLFTEKEKAMVEDFEKKYDAVVYHLIHQWTNIGELYSLLYVSSYEEEWEADREDLKNDQCLAYVINIDAPTCSEFGTIGVKRFCNWVARIW